jgi:hypothetical protein
MPGGKGLGAAGPPHANVTQRGVGASTRTRVRARMRRRAEEDAEMPEWSDDTYDPNDTQWARLDPTRGVPYDGAAADWSEQPTQPQPVIRPDDRYQRPASASAPFWPQEQRLPARDPQAEAVAARDRRRLVWGGLAVGAILLAATLALLTQLGLPGSPATVAPIQAEPHATAAAAAARRDCATSVMLPTRGQEKGPNPR